MYCPQTGFTAARQLVPRTTLILRPLANTDTVADTDSVADTAADTDSATDTAADTDTVADTALP